MREAPKPLTPTLSPLARGEGAPARQPDRSLALRSPRPACGERARVRGAALLAGALLLHTATATASPPSSPIRFEDVSARAGVALEHTPRSFAGRLKSQVLEMFTEGGAAVAVGDIDGDGWEDLFFTDSAEGKPNHLMRNRGDLTFEDVAAEAGVAGGNDPLSIVSDALFFDYDNDGRQDLLVARFGTPLLYRNLGFAGTGSVRFVEEAAAAGLTKLGNTIAAIAFDYDRDGFLDLLLGNYFQPLNLLDLKTPHVLPNDLDNAVNGGGVTLWRNVPREGGGRSFVETTADAGLGRHTGWTLDAGHADFDNDGWQDLYLACDYGTDRVFLNRGGRFEDVTEKAIGLDTRKGMNVDIADYDHDGLLDVYVTNITDEYMKECNMLWRNEGDGTFTDMARESGTCDTDWGWGAKFGDFDNDGWEDLFAANGLRSAGPENYIPVLLEMIITPGIDFTDLRSYPDIGDMTWSGYQKKRLFRNLGDGTFKEIGSVAGVANERDGRGVALADLDRDGRLDLVQTSANQAALLYRNASEPAGHWLVLELEGTKSNRDAVGAVVTLSAGGLTLLRKVDGGDGYAGQSSRRLHFGLGKATAIDALEIRWPSGAVEKLAPPQEGKSEGQPWIAVDSWVRIVEGKGVVAR